LITTGPDGSFNVYDASDTRVPGVLRFSTLNDRTVATWQVKDDITNRLKGNAAYTARVRSRTRAAGARARRKRSAMRC